MLPVLYKVGPEKARIAMLAIMGGFVLVVFLAIRGMEQAGQSGLLAAAAERIAALPAGPAGGGGAHPGGAVPAVLRHFLLYF